MIWDGSPIHRRAEVSEFVAETRGAVRVPEIKVYPLSEAAAAHKVSESRHLRGKLVFKVR